MANIRGKAAKPLLLHIAERTFMPGRHGTLLAREPLPYEYPFGDLNADAADVWAELRDIQEEALQTQNPRRRKTLAYSFSLAVTRLHEAIDRGDISIHDIMYAACGPSGRDVTALRNSGYELPPGPNGLWNEWRKWEQEHGAAWRLANSCMTPSDRELHRRHLIEMPDDPDAIPMPPGLAEFRALVA